jgi:hypothetical protein
MIDATSQIDRMQRAEIQRHVAQSSSSQQRRASFWARGAIGPEGVFLLLRFLLARQKKMKD